ncbi:MAG: hypothetical protein FWC71_07960 [Defluviitaleaceae bacterium]|nr:hypothetical protein [Defluviitaleaceae bacterium]
MVATRQRLHTLVDMIEEKGIETLYNVMIRFIPEAAPFPDEIAAHANAAEEYKRGDVVGEDDINWG